MANLMETTNFNSVDSFGNLCNRFNQAMRNPRDFEEFIKRTNPQAYQQALALRNMGSPQQIVMHVMQQQGVNPNVLQMLNM